MPAGDKEYPVREGWLKKQSGGQNAAGRSRRRSIGEFVKKWDERYFVLTMNRLCYYKTQQVRPLETTSKTLEAKREMSGCLFNRGSRTANLPVVSFWSVTMSLRQRLGRPMSSRATKLACVYACLQIHNRTSDARIGSVLEIAPSS
jgi:hypothetical protein